MNILTKISYILLVLFLYAERLNAQSSGEFGGGMLIGFCASQIDGDKLAGYNKMGATAGFFVNKKLSEKFMAQLEMRYNQKGAASGKEELSYKARLNYIEVPLMAIYNFKKMFKFEAGIQPSFLYRSRVLYGKTETSVKYNFLDIPYAIGVYYIMSEKIDFNVRFSYSTLTIRKSVSSDNLVYYGYNSFNNAINFVLYYHLK